MPEGDTVYRLAQRLTAALSGDIVTTFDLRVPQRATADCTGERIGTVLPYGKHLLMRIGDHTLHSHLRMDGMWRLWPAAGPLRGRPSTIRAIVGTARARAVGTDLSMLRLVPHKAEHALIDHLGPDVLAPAPDRDEMLRRLSNDTRPIHVALLDQRNVAGFGNVYGSEILFLRGIDPRTPTRQVELPALLDLGIRTIVANRNRPERTFTGVNRPGRRTWVYGRERHPCRRCTTPILRGELGADPAQQRVVFWCPDCQR